MSNGLQKWPKEVIISYPPSRGYQEKYSSSSTSEVPKEETFIDVKSNTAVCFRQCMICKEEVNREQHCSAVVIAVHSARSSTGRKRTEMFAGFSFCLHFSSPSFSFCHPCPNPMLFSSRYRPHILLSHMG
ncbi:hypothetical protein RND71_010811 [Anisodus tanguticus]|uniref:Uncharacterized protein n=1 Tax=Anisodus tanguticus TaxID=243964 RepID=A0AAE1VP51_9SOLA|nr:hypothetical protein RND71_010811 [Anisodus tanguticus]